MNHEKVMQLIKRICSWSYAHRIGNGQYSEEEQEAIINKCFWRLKDLSANT